MRILPLAWLLLSATICHAQTPSALNVSLFAAVQKGDVSLVQSLLERGANPNARGQYENTPLLASINGRRNSNSWINSEAMVRLLLKNGANPNLGVPKGTFPLMSARTNAPVLRMLLDAGASVDGRDDYGRTVLLQLCQYRLLTLPILQLLLERGADANARDEDGDTPLLSSVGNERNFGSWGVSERNLPFPILLDHLLAAGANINAHNSRGQTALINASYAQRDDIARKLLEHGANINARDKTGRNALMKACQILETEGMSSGSKTIYDLPSLSMVNLLLKGGADANARDEDGQTAFIWLSRNNFYYYIFWIPDAKKPQIFGERKAQITTVARLLIANGADVSIKTYKGNTALKWAKARGNKALVALLQAKGK